MVTHFISCCPEPRITGKLSDICVLRGNPAELTVEMSMDCSGTWFKDGEPVRQFTLQMILIQSKRENISVIFWFRNDK